MNVTPKTVVSGIRITPEQANALDRIGREFDVSRVTVMRWAIDGYITAFFSANRPMSKPVVTLVGQSDPR